MPGVAELFNVVNTETSGIKYLGLKVILYWNFVLILDIKQSLNFQHLFFKERFNSKTFHFND